MNILLLANSDIASNYALNMLVPRLAEHKLGLFLSSAVGANTARPEALQHLKFFEQQLFSQLLFPLLDANGGDGFHSFTGLGKWLSAPPEVVNRINSEEGLAMVDEFAPDLVLSIRYGGILRDQVIARPSLGVLNLHSGQLPAYRGVMASFWAMLAGEQLLGTTLHTIDDASIDTGRIVAMTETEVEADKSYLWNVLNLYPRGVAAMLAAVERLAAGQALETAAQQGQGAYFSFPEQQHLQDFAARGFRLFDPAEVVEFCQRHYLPGDGRLL